MIRTYSTQVTRRHVNPLLEVVTIFIERTAQGYRLFYRTHSDSLVRTQYIGHTLAEAKRSFVNSHGLSWRQCEFVNMEG